MSWRSPEFYSALCLVSTNGHGTQQLANLFAKCRCVRIRISECILAISATAVAYLAAEAAFLLVGLRYVPLRLHLHLPEDVRVFAQSSKSGVVPHDPVLLLGDSYAQGAGDWLLETDPNRNGPFHSAHVINRLTGRDVITLGVSGAYSKDAWYLCLPPPHVAVVYFSEGSDLNDNLGFLAHRVGNLDVADKVDRINRSIAAYPSELSVASSQAIPMSERSDSNNATNIASSDEPNIVGHKITRQSAISGNGTYGT